MTDTNTPIPNVPLTRTERADALAARIRARYPNVEDVSVTVSAPFGSDAAGTYVPGSYRVEIRLADGSLTLNYDDHRTVHSIMSGLFASYAYELGSGALRYENSPLVARARREAAIAAIVDVRAAMASGSATPAVHRTTLEALLAAAEREVYGVTATEEAKHEAEVDQSIAEHEVRAAAEDDE